MRFKGRDAWNPCSVVFRSALSGTLTPFCEGPHSSRPNPVPTDGLSATAEGLAVRAVTTQEMRRIDEIVVERFGLGILQMTDSAGRDFAEHALDITRPGCRAVVALAGPSAPPVRKTLGSPSAKERWPSASLSARSPWGGLSRSASAEGRSLRPRGAAPISENLTSGAVMQILGRDEGYCVDGSGCWCGAPAGGIGLVSVTC